MRYILIPVKDLTRAKQRLANLMTQAERTRLAWTMLETTFASAARAPRADRVAIVTLYPPAIDLAEKFGMEVIIETAQVSESASVDFGSKEAKKRGAQSVLRLPIDLPLITPADIEEILKYDQPKPSVVITPSRDGSGTNAILRRPPDLFPSHFGPGSFAKHMDEAERANVECRIVHLPRIALDIDDPADLTLFMREKRNSPVFDLLKEMGVDERLKAAESVIRP
jgi:2-phospho-L-lactate guanylyltransferase